MLKRTPSDKKGAVMMWAIAFGLVIFSIAALIVTMMASYRVNVKLAQESAQRRNDLNQIGEYFVRAVGSKSKFLNGADFNTTKLNGLSNTDYPWLDSEATTFFNKCNTDYGYSYVSEYGDMQQGNFWNFYRDEGRSRKLTVKSGNTELLSIVVTENITYDESTSLILTSSYNPETSFEIVEWTVHDEIDDLGGSETNFLTTIWQWVGSVLGRVDVATETCAVTYNYNYDDISTFTQYPKGSVITLPTPTRDGCTFNGWSYKSNTYNAGATYTVSQNVTFTANWEEYTGPTYSIVFHKNDGTTAEDPENNIQAPSYDISGNRDFERDGYEFAGWAKTETGTAISSPYTFQDSDTSVNLYAIWSAKTYNITSNETTVGSYTYNPSSSQTVQISYTPATGKTFAVSNTSEGSVNEEDKQKIDIPAGTFGDITVTITEDWIYHTISAGSHTNGGGYEIKSITYGETNSSALDEAHYGATVTFTASATNGVDSVTVKAKDGDTTITTTGSYSFTMPNYDVTITVKGKQKSGGCFAPGTLITMADGTKKKIEDVKYGDMVKSYSFYSGKIVDNPVVSLEKVSNTDYTSIDVFLESGKHIEIAQHHSLFDMDSREYFEISQDNYSEHIGKRVMVIENGEILFDVIKTVSLTQKCGDYYSPITAYDYNVIANGILTVNPVITDIMLFSVNDEYMFDTELMENDIQMYGVTDYSEWSAYMSREAYEMTNLKYLDILCAKGNVTREYVLSWLLHSFNENIQDIFT